MSDTNAAAWHLVEAAEAVVPPAPAPPPHSWQRLEAAVAALRAELATDEDAETLLAVWLCTRRGGLPAAPSGELLTARSLAVQLVADLDAEVLRRNRPTTQTT